MFKIPNWASKTATNEFSPLDKNKEAFQIGLLIAKLITSYWNSQKTQAKPTFLTGESIMAR